MYTVALGGEGDEGLLAKLECTQGRVFPGLEGLLVSGICDRNWKICISTVGKGVCGVYAVGERLLTSIKLFSLEGLRHSSYG